MKKNSLVVTVSLLLSACAVDPDERVCNIQGHYHDIGVHSTANVVHSYSGSKNETGFENLYERYRSLDKIYYYPTFYIVEGSYLVNLSPAHNGAFKRNQPYDQWLYVQLGEHYKECSGEYQNCLSHEELFDYYEQTNSHRFSYDRELFNTTKNHGSNLLYPGDEQIFFPFNSSALDRTALTTLDQVKQYLYRYPTRVLLIVGRADATGNSSYNLSLSKRRAMSVYDKLISQGIPKQRLKVAWKGERDSGYGQPFRIAELNYESSNK